MSGYARMRGDLRVRIRTFLLADARTSTLPSCPPWCLFPGAPLQCPPASTSCCWWDIDQTRPSPSWDHDVHVRTPSPIVDDALHRIQQAGRKYHLPANTTNQRLTAIPCRGHPPVPTPMNERELRFGALLEHRLSRELSGAILGFGPRQSTSRHIIGGAPFAVKSSTRDHPPSPSRGGPSILSTASPTVSSSLPRYRLVVDLHSGAVPSWEWEWSPESNLIGAPRRWNSVNAQGGTTPTTHARLGVLQSRNVPQWTSPHADLLHFAVWHNWSNG